MDECGRWRRGSGAGVTETHPRRAPRRPEAAGLAHCDLCVIGASTGGPAAIQRILQGLPRAGFPLPIVVVQHMPVGIHPAVRAAARGALPAAAWPRRWKASGWRRAGCGSRPAGAHLRIVAEPRRGAHAGAGRRQAHPEHRRHDAIRRALAARAGSLGILLTGMGEDGADGMAAIRAGGGRHHRGEREPAAWCTACRARPCSAAGRGWCCRWTRSRSCWRASAATAVSLVGDGGFDPAQVGGVAVGHRHGDDLGRVVRMELTEAETQSGRPGQRGFQMAVPLRGALDLAIPAVRALEGPVTCAQAAQRSSTSDRGRSVGRPLRRETSW